MDIFSQLIFQGKISCVFKLQPVKNETYCVYKKSYISYHIYIYVLYISFYQDQFWELLNRFPAQSLPENVVPKKMRHAMTCKGQRVRKQVRTGIELMHGIFNYENWGECIVSICNKFIIGSDFAIESYSYSLSVWHVGIKNCSFRFATVGLWTYLHHPSNVPPPLRGGWTSKVILESWDIAWVPGVMEKLLFCFSVAVG